MAETYPYGGCGIAGGIATQKGTLPNINVMLEHLRHRGPDANGTWQEEGVFIQNLSKIPGEVEEHCLCERGSSASISVCLHRFLTPIRSPMTFCFLMDPQESPTSFLRIPGCLLLI
jgi:hypothetical protein